MIEGLLGNDQKSSNSGPKAVRFLALRPAVLSQYSKSWMPEPEPSSPEEQQPKKLLLVPQRSDVRIARSAAPQESNLPPIPPSIRWSISKATVLALLAVLGCLVLYREFWWDVLNKFIGFVEKARSATLYSMGVMCAFYMLYGIIRSKLTMKEIFNQWRENLPIIWKSSIGHFLKFVSVVALIVFFFISAPQVYNEKKSTLDKLTPNGAPKSYETLADEIATNKDLAQNERKGRIKAEERAEYYRKKGIEWLLANTNASTFMVALDEAISVAKKDRDKASTDPHQLATVLERGVELKQLEQKKYSESQRIARANYIPMLQYVALAYEEAFSDRVSKCGEKLNPFPPIPSLDWWYPTDGFITNFISTNCGARFECSFGRQGDPITMISIFGIKTSARVEFILTAGSRASDPHLNSRFYLGNNAYSTEKISSPTDKTNWINDVNFIFGLLAESQSKEFQ